ncbi:MAG TPA: hypothetical protein VMJ10_29975 [Kofleriaceae bacterium]|nr:hypothetical protein [Kofleriaceae bacterium]
MLKSLPAIAIVASCGAPGVVPPQPAHGSPVANSVTSAPAPRLEPFVVPSPRGDETCHLRGDEIDEVAPPVIALAAWTPAGGGDDCPTGFVATVTDSAACSGCESGRTHDGRRVRLVIDGPNGSEHLFALGLAVDGTPTRFACLPASTVGIRALGGTPDGFGRMPWLADLDHDGASELVVWEPLAWGDAAVQTALFPVVYAIDGDRLVRRDDRAKELRHTVAGWYAAKPHEECFATIARALGG